MGGGGARFHSTDSLFNAFQSAAMAHEVVDEDAVYTCVGRPLKKDINMIVDWLMNKQFKDAYQSKQ